MSKNKLVAAAAAVIALGSIAGAVWAATTTNAPGAYCVAASGALTVRTDGEVENNGTTTATAICPSERAMSPSASTKVSGTVFVVDRHPTLNLCCKMVSKNAGGTLTTGAQACAVNSNTTTYQALALPEISDPYGFSSYFIQCSVPPESSTGLASRIQLYRTTQE